MGEVIIAPFITKLDVPAERILKGALEAGLRDVVVCGYTEDGDEYFASSVADGGTTLWLMERCKGKLLGMPDTLTEEGA